MSINAVAEACERVIEAARPAAMAEPDGWDRLQDAIAAHDLLTDTGGQTSSNEDAERGELRERVLRAIETKYAGPKSQSHYAADAVMRVLAIFDQKQAPDA